MKLSKILKPSSWRLAPKLLVAFLLTAVVPALAASLFSLTYFYDASFAGAQRNLGKELGIARHFFEEGQRRLETDTRLASRENVVAVNLSLGLTAPVLDYLSTLRAERHLKVAALVDATGRWLSEGPALVSAARLDEARQKNGLSFLEDADGRVLLLSVVPVVDEGGRVSFYLVTGTDPGSSESGGLLDTVGELASGPVVFGSALGLLGTSPGSPAWDSPVAWPRELPPEGTLLPVTAHGSPYLFGFSRAGQTDAGPVWIGVSFSLETFQRVTQAAEASLILIALLCVTLSCVAAVIFSRGLTRPLLMMARQASAWTEGQGGKRLDVTAQDETGVLGRAFNEVLDRLDGTLYSLRKTQNYLKNIFNSLTSVLVSIDETGTVQEWNVAAERFNGTKASEALGKKVWDLSPVFAGLGPLLDRAVTTREPQFLKKDLGRNHDKRNFDLCLYPLVWNGVSGVVIRMDDITDSLKKDRQLRQAQKMETIGTMTEGIAHNFNNLLTGITGTASLAALELDDGKVDADQLRLRLAMIEDSTRKAAEIVRRLMGLTRGSPGEFSAMDLGAVVREVAKTGRMVLDKSVEVEVHVPEVPALVHGDRSQLEQCLLNLVINASHAMTFMRSRGEHGGGTVRLTLHGIAAVNDFLASHPGAIQSDYWLVRVQDNGVGISQDNLPKIFDPFFTTKDMDKGSGLGLAMVYASVRQHNGFIDVYSEVDRGTTFSLYFPVLSTAAPGAPESALRVASPLHRGHGLILVVDDEVVVQKTAQMILEACGYQVITANNGVEALELYAARGREIRALIMDSSMPKLSGAETLAGLRKLDPEVRVVMSSGLFDGNRVLESFGGAHVRFLPKPYSLAELSQVLKELLET
jgi:PAS domain S-box-containing protein